MFYFAMSVSSTRVIAETLRRAWALGPAKGRLAFDVDVDDRQVEGANK